MGRFRKVLVANRGAVAARVIRALSGLKIPSVAVYSEADRDAPYLGLADETYCIGPAPANASYLNQDVLLDCLRASGADAVHPGYGFLSENAEFAQRVIASGAAFIGPSPEWIDRMGDKIRAREFAVNYGLPIALGSAALPADPAQMIEAARRIGFPVLVKPSGGGGGIGMMPASNDDELLAAAERASALSQRFFKNGEIYLERLIERPRHIEIQVLGDRHGRAIHLFERECSIQRRHQKVIEEAPAPTPSRQTLLKFAAPAIEKMGCDGYDSLGTIEMLMGADGEFAFLEMNTRLQVEHGVTEEIAGVDLVGAQIRAADGEALDSILPAPVSISGHAIQARVYAEDPRKFLPSPGPLRTFRPPDSPSVRVETGYKEGMEVSPHYDPLIAKVIVHETDREGARRSLIEALRAFAIEGIKSNIPALLAVLECPAFVEGQADTGLLTRVISGQQ